MWEDRSNQDFKSKISLFFLYILLLPFFAREEKERRTTNSKTLQKLSLNCFTLFAVYLNMNTL